MTRLAVLSPSDQFHRLLRQEVQARSDLRIDLYARSVRELGSLGSIDVLVFHRVEGEARAAALSTFETIPVVVAADRADVETLRELEGRDGWAIVGDESPARVLAAAAAVAQGLVVREPVHEESSRGGEWAVRGEPGGITEREREMLRELSMGRSNRSIAETLGISENTVKYHLRSLFVKLDVTNRSQAVLEGMRRGWVTL